MDSKLKALEQDVERMRERLHQTVGENRSDLSAAVVLSVSRRLDELILEYYREKEREMVSRSG